VPKTVINIPSIDNSKVGVKFPVVGTGAAEAVEVADGVAVASLVATGEALGLTVWEGVATKAGPSAAWTTKFLVNDLVIPVASFQVTVIVCAPGSSPVGTAKLHEPFLGTVTF
jgi:hypothetical protein